MMAKVCWVLHRLWERLSALRWRNHLFSRLCGGGAHGDEEESVFWVLQIGETRGDREERSHRGPRQQKQAEGMSPELREQDWRISAQSPF